MLPNSDSSEIDQNINHDQLKNLNMLNTVNLTPKRSLDKHLDASPFATDSILSEMERGTLITSVI